MAASKPFFSAAPMEGLTGFVWRAAHSRFFGSADAYYTPFVTPTLEPRFTERQLRELAPEVNAGRNVIPQLLTRRPADFVWAARALRDMGYREVNLNLGCPAGTVVAKGKGAGFLRTPSELADFLRIVFDEVQGIDVSVKTRIGWSEESEFEDLADLYAHFPICRLIVHPRLKFLCTSSLVCLAKLIHGWNIAAFLILSILIDNKVCIAHADYLLCILVDSLQWNHLRYLLPNLELILNAWNWQMVEIAIVIFATEL